MLLKLLVDAAQVTFCRMKQVLVTIKLCRPNNQTVNVQMSGAKSP